MRVGDGGEISFSSRTGAFITLATVNAAMNLIDESGFRGVNDSLVIHFRTLRRTLGIIGMALPFVLVIGENLRDRFARQGVPPADRAVIEVSISAYFHTGMRDVFVGAVCAIAVFLICYKGYERIDNLVANLAGFAALLVALFPTPEEPREAPEAETPLRDSITLFSGPYAPDPAFVGWIHFAASAAFFILLAGMSLFLFTRSDPTAPPNPWKEQRNFIYRVCGIVMLVCVAAIPLVRLLLSEAGERSSSFVFWLEAIAVVAFGVSWLTKGGGVCRDRPEPPRWRPIRRMRAWFSAEGLRLSAGRS
ncbi:MAG TPA: hypothetical protein VF234_10695 [Limnochordia bacterium]